MNEAEQIKFCRTVLQRWKFPIEYLISEQQQKSISEFNLTSMYAINHQLTQKANYLDEKKFIELLYDSSVDINFISSAAVFHGNHFAVINGEQRELTGDTMIAITRNGNDLLTEYYIAPADFKQYIEAGCRVTDDDLRRVNHVGYLGQLPSEKGIWPSWYPGLFYIDTTFGHNLDSKTPIIVSGVPLTSAEILEALAKRSEGEVPKLPQKRKGEYESTVQAPRSASEEMISENFIGKNIRPATYDRCFSVGIDKENNEKDHKYTIKFKISLEGANEAAQDLASDHCTDFKELAWVKLRLMRFETKDAIVQYGFEGDKYSGEITFRNSMTYLNYIRVSRELLEYLTQHLFSIDIPILKDPGFYDRIKVVLPPSSEFLALFSKQDPESPLNSPGGPLI